MLKLRGGAGVWQALLVDTLEFELCDLLVSWDVEGEPREVWDFLDVDLEDLDLRK